MYPPLSSSESDDDWDMEKGDNGLHRWEGIAASFRVRPIEATLTPFLLAFTKAAQTMSRLRRAMLWTTITWAADDEGDAYGDSSNFDAAAEISIRHDAPLAWGIAFAQAGEQAFDTQPGVSFASGRQANGSQSLDCTRSFSKLGRSTRNNRMQIILGLTLAFLCTTPTIIAAELDSQAAEMRNELQPAFGERDSYEIGVLSSTERTLAETHIAIAQSWVPNIKAFQKGKTIHESVKRGLENRATPKKTPASPVKPPAPKTPTSKPPVVKPAPAKLPSAPLKPKPIKTCQQLAMADTSDMLVERGGEFENVNPGSLRDLVKRARKPGTVCRGIQLNAYDYPSRGKYIERHPHKNYYGFANPYDCDNYVWRANSSVEPADVQAETTDLLCYLEMWDDSIAEIHGKDEGTTGMAALLNREPRTVA
ncbi:hypothetical protein E8E13_005326 [Curvularia kusanoi]|uniref:Uncharacterized protein n=1 Tax=Curvularia kusanoi TaxID=90978 RepID=A0A9P4T894_CURKU|nr:hypothetical protein E8E13_005326 [Curvularia kusanoi]